jgi:hypothetical protein
MFLGFVVGWIEQADESCESEESNRFGAIETRLATHGAGRMRLNVLAADAAARGRFERSGYAPHEVLYEKRSA